MGWLDALITVGGDVAGSFIGDPMLGNQIEGVKGMIQGGKKGSTTGPTSPAYRRAEQLGDLSKNYAFDYALPEGKKLLGEAESSLQGPADYYSKLLSGNRAEMMGAVAPEMQTIADQFGQAKSNISKFTPQGGGQTSLLSELPFQQSRAGTELLEKVRPEAAKGMERVSAAQGALSGMVTGEGLQAGSQAQNAINAQIDALLGQQRLDAKGQEAAGKGMYQMLQQMLGGGVSTGGSSDPSSVSGFDPNLESAVGGVPMDPISVDPMPAPVIGPY
jgi:hypothetical protein